MCGCESWTIKKAECWRTDDFEMWCWRRLLRVFLTARRSNQLIPKEINPEYSLEGLMLKPKPQYFGHLLQRADIAKTDLSILRLDEALWESFKVALSFPLFPIWKSFQASLTELLSLSPHQHQLGSRSRPVTLSFFLPLPHPKIFLKAHIIFSNL